MNTVSPERADCKGHTGSGFRVYGTVLAMGAVPQREIVECFSLQGED